MSTAAAVAAVQSSTTYGTFDLSNTSSPAVSVIHVWPTEDAIEAAVQRHQARIAHYRELNTPPSEPESQERPPQTLWQAICSCLLCRD